MKWYLYLILLFSTQSLSLYCSGQSIDSTKKETRNDSLALIDTPARFPGGDNALKKFIKKNLQYPAYLLKDTLSGKYKVSVLFTVESNGEITNVKIIQGFREDLNNEAVRLVRSFPKWEPALFSDKRLRSRVVLPITFTIPEIDFSGLFPTSIVRHI